MNKLNFDLLKGLPQNMTSWPIWLGDHYEAKNLNIPQIIYILISEFGNDFAVSFKWCKAKDINSKICRRFEEYDDVWQKFCEGAGLAAECHFEHKVCDVVPGFSNMLKQYREN